MIKKLINIMMISTLVLFISSVHYADDFDDDAIVMGTKRGTKISKSKKEKNMVQSRVQFRVFDQAKNKTVKIFNFGKLSKRDRFLIRLKTSKPVYVYVFNIDTANKLTVIFPNKEINKTNPLEADKVISLPPDNRGEILWYGFSRFKGREQFYTFMSEKPHPALEKIIKRVPAKGLSLKNPKNRDLFTKLYKLYVQAGKNSVIDKSNPEILWFNKLSSRKFTLNIGEKKRPEKLYPIGSAIVTLVQDREVRKLNTAHNGILTINFPTTSSIARIITEYHGYILEGHIRLYSFVRNKPTRYQLYARQIVQKIDGSQHPFELYVKQMN